MKIGDKHKIAFVIGERTDRDLRRVDIYIANQLVTYFDNTTYVPQFVASIEYEASGLAKGNIGNEYVFLNWGPTTDDVVARGVLDENSLKLHCELGNGKEVNIRLPVAYVISVYRSTTNALRELHA